MPGGNTAIHKGVLLGIYFELLYDFDFVRREALAEGIFAYDKIIGIWIDTEFQYVLAKSK